MSFLKKLFGGGSSGGAPAEPSVVDTETYEGHLIEAMPEPEGGQYRLRARLSKTIGEETKTHDLIRADLLGSADEAASYAIRKARQVIDEQGDRLYG
ncbi:MAG: HlyU family transcriptional regulator [Pseudomonadota bacterium]